MPGVDFSRVRELKRNNNGSELQCRGSIEREWDKCLVGGKRDSGPEKRLDFPVTKPADRLVNASGDINRAEQQSYKPGGGSALAGEHKWSPNRAIGNLVATWHRDSDCPNDSSSWHTFNRRVQSRHHRYALYRPTGG